MRGIPHRDMSAKLTDSGHVLFVPPAHVMHKQEPIAFCQVIVNGDGELCMEPFFNQRDRLNHVPGCARQHESAINAYRKRTHPEIMQSWDPELSNWMAQHKDAILTGRMKV